MSPSWASDSSSKRRQKSGAGGGGAVEGGELREKALEAALQAAMEQVEVLTSRLQDNEKGKTK